MIDHITLLVSDYARSKAFYTAALAPLGYSMLMELTKEQMPNLPCDAFCGFGKEGPKLWLRPSADAIVPTHVAVLAADTASVDAFHVAALAAGATDHGAPGPRPEYHPGYYGAFVLDPDGYNFEAVFHGAG